MNYKMIRYTIGWILIFEAAFFLLPTITAAIFRESAALLSFAGTILICLLAGVMLKARKPAEKTLRARDGFVLVAASWIFMSIFGALPFLFCGATNSFTDAFFESVSGFTTTGATIFGDVESLPKSILLWRSFTHWIGGMGVLVFIMAFLPLSGGQNMHIMKAESPGPSVSKLVPRVRTTAALLYAIYIALTLVQIPLLLLGGMSFFDALNTAFSTAGTGGFGFRNDSMNSFSPYIQVVVTIFMLLFSINFGSYFLILRGKFKESLTEEVRTFFIIVLSAVALITVSVYKSFNSVGEAIRHVFFTVASLISTTGFSTVDFDLWPLFACTVLVLIMFIGACAGSTGGGMKVSRIMIIGKSIKKELTKAIYPKRTKKIYIDGRVQDDSVVQAVFGYLLCMIAVFVVSIFLLSINGFDLVTNFTAVVATIGNVGPGLNGVGPSMNYAGFSIFSKFILIFDMLAGRLEFYPILLLMLPATWKK